MDHEFFTIIINTYPSDKREEELKQTLNSIFSQTYKNYQILIVENYQDQSKIKPLINPYQNSTTKIKIINDPKKKLSYLFDLGWRKAQTEYIAYIADDIEIKNDWLERVHQELSTDPKIGVVTGPNVSAVWPTGEMHRLYLISQKNIFTKILAWPYLHFAMEDKVLAPGNLFESGAYSLGAALPEAVHFKRQEIDLATTSAMGTRKSILEEVGGFDTRFNFNHADGDLFIRIKKASYKITFNPQIVSLHHLRLGPSRNSYFVGLDTGVFYRKHVRPRSISGVIGALMNICLLNFYWIYSTLRTGNPKQLKGATGFFKGLINL